MPKSGEQKDEVVESVSWDQIQLEKVRGMTFAERSIYVASFTSSQRISVLKHMSPQERETCKPMCREGTPGAATRAGVESKTPTWRTNLTLNSVKLRK